MKFLNISISCAGIIERPHIIEIIEGDGAQPVVGHPEVPEGRDIVDIRKQITRMGVASFSRIGVSSSIEDWMLDDIEGICSYLKLKQIPKSLKGTNGNARLCDLYSKARRIYSKGYPAREMISSLNFSLIRDKRQPSLQGLEEALGVQQTP